MTTTAALASYAQAASSTATPHEVVRMAYDRILTACDRATFAAQTRPASWLQTFHDETIRAQSILLELTAGLNVTHFDRAVVDLSQQLAELYRYSIQQLVDANMRKSARPLTAVHDVIDGLRDAWISNPR